MHTHIKVALYNKLNFINKIMPKKKNDDEDDGIKAFLIGLGLGAIGFGIMSLFVKPKCPNPKCSKPIKQGISRCPYCRTEIEWKVN